MKKQVERIEIGYYLVVSMTCNERVERNRGVFGKMSCSGLYGFLELFLRT